MHQDSPANAATDTQSAAFQEGLKVGLEMAGQYWRSVDARSDAIAKKTEQYRGTGVAGSHVGAVEREHTSTLKTMALARLEALIGNRLLSAHASEADVHQFGAGMAAGIREIHKTRQAASERQSGYRFGIQFRRLAHAPDPAAEDSDYADVTRVASAHFMQGVHEAFEDYRLLKDQPPEKWTARYSNALLHDAAEQGSVMFRASLVQTVRRTEEAQRRTS